LIQNWAAQTLAFNVNLGFQGPEQGVGKQQGSLAFHNGNLKAQVTYG
jgi:hypothetical protein